VYPGLSFGAHRPASGEVVFTTGMVGYPEALTDPSYRGQILIFTYPSLGNYGVPSWASAAPGSGRDGSSPCARPFESERIHLAGVVCAAYSSVYSHRTAAHSLGEWLAAQGTPGLTGVDTRALTKKIRMHGALLGRIEIAGRPAPEITLQLWAIESILHSSLVRDPSGEPSSKYARRYHSPSHAEFSTACT